MNRTVQEATVKAFHYPDLAALRAHILAFVTACNLARHLRRCNGEHASSGPRRLAGRPLHLQDRPAPPHPGATQPKISAKWYDETPDGFVFAFKAPRFATNRRVLAETGDSIERFFASGLLELTDKLGPINLRRRRPGRSTWKMSAAS